MKLNRWTSVAATVIAALIVAGCGSSNSSRNPNVGGPSAATSTSGAGSGGAGALSAEANSAATGDIPDNQVFLVFVNHAAGYSLKYPEGWTQSGSANSARFSDKNNQVRVLVAAGPSPTPASMSAELNSLKRSTPSLSFQPPHPIQLPAGPAVMTTYTTLSAPNSVTGKRVLLIVDRYEIGKRGRVATIDLGTPRGVDNKDAYRLISRSFTWR